MAERKTATETYVDTAPTLVTPGSLTVVLVSGPRTASYTLVLTDAGKVIEMNHATTALTVTIPTNASVAFPEDTVIEVFRVGDGDVTVAAAVGVTIRSPGGLLGLASRFSTASLRQRNIDEWVLSGDLA